MVATYIGENNWSYIIFPALCQVVVRASKLIAWRWVDVIITPTQCISPDMTILRVALGRALMKKDVATISRHDRLGGFPARTKGTIDIELRETPRRELGMLTFKPRVRSLSPSLSTRS
jgi:hypothetical protein